MLALALLCMYPEWHWGHRMHVFLSFAFGAGFVFGVPAACIRHMRLITGSLSLAIPTMIFSLAAGAALAFIASMILYSTV
ncbi:MAG: hypothetical protein R3F30_00715 [Planctomycetota bacterium]